MNDFERVKEKLDIMAVAGRYTHLKKTGKSFTGLCPIHSEKTGSFTVDKEKQSFYCFGCKAGGDAIDLVSLKENVDLYTALEMLAAEKDIQLSTEDNANYQRRKELQKKQATLVEVATKRSAQKEAVEYLLQRGINQESVQRFKIGYGDKNHSIIIPLVDYRNLSIGYCERFIGEPPEGFKGKYRIPSENPDSKIYNELFKKNDFLFNEYNARKALKEDQYLLIFEGQFDVIAADQIGFPASVACMQSSLTTEQAKRVVKLAEINTVVVLVPDKNKTGMLSVKQNAEVLRGINAKIPIKVMILPFREHENGKEYDMNDFVKDGFTRESAETHLDSLEVALIDLMMSQTTDIHLQHEYARDIASSADTPFTKERISDYLAKRWGTDVEKVDMLLKITRDVDLFKKCKNIDDLYSAYMEKIFSFEENNLTLGYPELDAILNSGMGVPTGWVLDFLARSSVGKTAFALNVIANATHKHNVGCTFFSFEQQGSDLYPKISAIRNNISQKRVFSEYISSNDEIYHKNVQDSLKRKLLVYEEGRLTLAQIVDVVIAADDNFFDTVPQKIVLIDYLGYIKANGIQNKYEAMSELTAEIKQAAKRTNKLWIVLVQTSRKGGDGSEALSFDDARDSGTIEENADILLGAYRPELNKDMGSREIIEVLDDYMVQVLKNRNGPSNVTIRLKFDKPEQIIREWATGEKKILQNSMIDIVTYLGEEEERIKYLREGRTSI
jgi:hypothetical protein